MTQAINSDSILKDVTKLHRELQESAGICALACKEKLTFSMTTDKIVTLTLPLLFGGVTVASIALGAHVIVPIAAGLITLVLLAYLIYEVNNILQDRWQAQRLQPIFTDIIHAKYGDAHQKLEDILKDLSYDECVKLDISFRRHDWRDKNQVTRFGFIHAATTALEVFKALASGKKFTEEQLSSTRQELEKHGDRMRGGRKPFPKLWMDNFEFVNNSTENFSYLSSTPITALGSYLISIMLEDLKELPLQCLKNNYNCETIHSYIRLIQKHERDSLEPPEQALADALLQCNTFEEMLNKIKSTT